mmetsp:Transcript_108925/g.259902  ORF Transcript_108925/g.259902 Transcript_108925/m.259902 type:complete len:345 (-) Transcript_108925:133-1167(-)
MLQHISGNGLPFGPSLGILHPEGEVPDLVRHIGEGRVHVHVPVRLRLQAKVPRHPRHVQTTLNLTALVEHGVVLCHHQMAVPNGVGDEVDDVLNTSLVLELLKGPVALVQADARKGLDLLLLALGLEVHAVHLQELHRGLLPIGILELHLLADPASSLVPHGGELSTVHAPLSEEVHQGELVEGHRGLEVLVLEVIAGGGPVCVQLLLLGIGHVRDGVGLLEESDLLLGVGHSLVLALMVDRDVMKLIRTVDFLLAELVPNTNLEIPARQVVHQDVKIDLNQFIVVLVHDDIRLVVFPNEGTKLCYEQKQEHGISHCREDAPGEGAFRKIPRHHSKLVQIHQRA